MAVNEQTLMLEGRARRAYEAGRLRSALRLAPFVVLAAVAAVACGRPMTLALAVGGVLLPLSVGLSFAGRAPGRAVVPGLLAGGAALVMPLLVATVGHACFGPACMSLCLPACVVGGAIAGAVIARTATVQGRDPAFLAPALAIAALTGSLGCTISGAAGVIGMLAGVVAAGTPLLVAARR
jgi:hypothetical protein